MTQKQKKKPYLKLVKPLNLDELKKKARQYRRSRLKKWGLRILLGGMAVLGTWMLITNHAYHRRTNLLFIQGKQRTIVIMQHSKMELSAIQETG